MAVSLVGWVLVAVFGLALAVAIGFGRAVKDSLDAAERLMVTDQALKGSLDVIIPAFNEADNIKNCVTSVLASCDRLALKTQVWVADDQSTDDTLAIAQSLAQQDDRVQIFSVPPRPTNTLWYGKNWACDQVAQQLQADYLLFLDADVSLDPDCLIAALQKAQTSDADLLTICLDVQCQILAEWVIQPVIFALIMGFCNFREMNDDTKPDKTFGFGPFMLFRRSAYEQLGGHRRVSGNPVEDVALARLLKISGLKFRTVLANGLARVQMYGTFAALFEGWSKNFHLGFGRSIFNSLGITVIVLMMWSVPQLSLPVAIAYLGMGWALSVSQYLMLGSIMLLLSLVLQIVLIQNRATVSIVFPAPLKYGYLSFLGGILVGAIAIASIIKTETGWGWTWRGRSLAGANAFTPDHPID